MRKIYILAGIFLTFILSVRPGYSFDLCPACSPETTSEDKKIPGYMLARGKFSFIALYRLSEQSGMHTAEHTGPEQALVSFNYGLTDRLKTGLMYGFSSKKLSLQIDYLVLQEKDLIPSLILGTGSFRGIFSESHPYIVATKDLKEHMKLPVKISFGIKHKGDDLSNPQIELIGNLIFNLFHSVHLMGIFEGEEFDLSMYGVMFNKIIVGIRMIDLKTPAIGIVFRI